ncbi:hypothetical protein H4219_000212 [Mycoemilia scoparia]|uniref:Rab-GAP TBC domain-containing protein n=1 Tax=Mycoemilia scoparia TaxID=417184 RepID=A0A9W8A416_9FUNG|nr:hypothetical protein H4219_000212 [Mycoemilia scoparia]
MLTLYQAKEQWEALTRASFLSSKRLRSLAFSPFNKNPQSSTELPFLPLRSLCWRIYLGVLPDDVFGQEDDCIRVWPTHIEKERSAYEQLRTKWVVNPHTADHLREAEADLSVLNPLSQDENSPWKQYFEDQELKDIIRKDVVRTFPDDVYYQSERVQNIMTNVLFVYSKVHSSISYRQGMHELLAPLLAAIDIDSVNLTNTDPYQLSNEAPMIKVVFEILDHEFIEHDTYTLFDHLMRTCASWYHVPNESYGPRPKASAKKRQAFASKQQAQQLDKIRQRDIERSVPIVAKCHQLLNEKLTQVDPDLANHIIELKIEPQLFGIRWFRLLFSREITDHHNMFALWDCIFADNANGLLGLSEWIAIVLFLVVRTDIIEGDYTVCLQKLLNFPKLEEPSPSCMKETPPLYPAQPSSQTKGPTPGHSSLYIPYNLPQPNHPSLLPSQRIAIHAIHLRARPFPSTAEGITSQWDYWTSREALSGPSYDEQSSPVRRRASTLPDIGDLESDHTSVYSDPLSNHPRSVYAMPIPIASPDPNRHFNSPRNHPRSPMTSRQRNQHRRHYTGANIRQQTSAPNSQNASSKQPPLSSTTSSSPNSFRYGSDTFHSIISSSQSKNQDSTLFGQPLGVSPPRNYDELVSLGSLTQKSLCAVAKLFEVAGNQVKPDDSVVLIEKPKVDAMLQMLSELSSSWEAELNNSKSSVTACNGQSTPPYDREYMTHAAKPPPQNGSLEQLVSDKIKVLEGDSHKSSSHVSQNTSASLSTKKSKLDAWNTDSPDHAKLSNIDSSLDALSLNKNMDRSPNTR